MFETGFMRFMRGCLNRDSGLMGLWVEGMKVFMQILPGSDYSNNNAVSFNPLNLAPLVTCISNK